MNPDQPSREQIEARLTALLLGELPADEAALLRYTISQDPALKKLHDELQSTLALVREAEKNPASTPTEKPAPLTLSTDRREKLLAHFKTPRTETKREPLFWLKRITAPSLIEVLVVVSIIAIVAAMLLPSLSAAKSKSKRAAALNEARQRELAMELSQPEKIKTPPPPVAAAPAAGTVTSEPKPVAPPVQIVLPAAQLADNNGFSTQGNIANAQNAGVAMANPHLNSAQPASAERNSFQSSPTRPQPNIEDQVMNSARELAEIEQNRIATKDLVDHNLYPPLPPTLLTPPDATTGDNFAGGGGGFGPSPMIGQGAVVLSGINPDAGAKFEEQKNAGNKQIGAVNSFGGQRATYGRLTPDSNSRTLALNDSGVNRSFAENQPGAPAATTGRAYRLPVSPDTTRPAELPALAYDKTEKIPKDRDQKNPQVQNPASITASPAPTPPPTQPSVPIAATTFAFDTVTDAIQTKRIDDAKQTDKPGSRSLALNGNTTFAADAPVAAGDVTLGVPSDSFKTDAIRQNEGGVAFITTNGLPSSSTASENRSAFIGRYAYLPGQVQMTNALTMNDVKQTDVPTLERATVDLVTKDLEKSKNQPYDEAKRDLEQKLRMHELLYSKLEAEKLDMNLPKTSMVQITDPAEPGKSENTWQRLTGQVESKARIKVENDITDISGLNGTPIVATTGYDPYFIQTTFEVMQSEAVLGKVVDTLDLQSAWAKNNGGKKLTKNEAITQLKQRLELHPVKNTKLIEIGAKSNDPTEAADIANAVAKSYADYRVEARRALTTNGVTVLEQQFAQQNNDIRLAQAKVERLGKELSSEQTTPAQTAEQADLPLRKPAPNTPLPQPEIPASSNAFSTFSLNVSDVSFKLAEASLQNGKLPDTASIRSEEFINAFDYRDSEAAAGQPMAFTSERARYPFAVNRDLLRFSIKTAAAGRQAGRALNLVLLLDNSGSMERADRVAIIREALHVLATQLQPQDTVSVVTFARTARLWADGVSGAKVAETLNQVGGITPEGGTNLEEAMRLAYETARRHYLANGMNRVVLLTDGAANLGNVEPSTLKEKVEVQRKQGIALDCFGIGWEDFNDDLLAQLSSNGDGRYAFLNSPEDAANEFAAKLAGALQVAASDVKVQVEFNPRRVVSYRQIGYATHQLTKEQFRDNTVDAAEIAAQEAGNALYTVETNPNGDGPIATVRVRYKVPGTTDYRERSWDVAYTGNAPALEQASPAMRLATTASAFSEWLAASPFAQEVTPDELLKNLSGVPEIYGADTRPKQLETMIREAKSLEGK